MMSSSTSLINLKEFIIQSHGLLIIFFLASRILAALPPSRESSLFVSRPFSRGSSAFLREFSFVSLLLLRLSIGVSLTLAGSSVSPRGFSPIILLRSSPYLYSDFVSSSHLINTLFPTRLFLGVSFILCLPSSLATYSIQSAFSSASLCRHLIYFQSAIFFGDSHASCLPSLWQFI
jgi:hypothetical protein